MYKVAVMLLMLLLLLLLQLFTAIAHIAICIVTFTCSRLQTAICTVRYGTVQSSSVLYLTAPYCIHR